MNNFLNVMKKMVNVPGWEILEESDILAMKSGFGVSLINFVWGVITQENLSRIESFYNSASFSYAVCLEFVADDKKDGVVITLHKSIR